MTNTFQTNFNSQKIWAHHFLPSALICKELPFLMNVSLNCHKSHSSIHQKINTLMHTEISLSTELQHCQCWLLSKILKLALAQASTVFLFTQPQTPSVPWVCLAWRSHLACKGVSPKCPIYWPFFPKSVSGFLQNKSFLSEIWGN